MATKRTYIFIALLLICSAGMAQNMTFSMSPIVSASNGFNMSGGTPVVIDGNSKCLNVSTGGVLNVNNHSKGNFGASCVETAPAATLFSITSLKVYPNPTHSTSILKCEGMFDINLSCQVRIMSIDGRLMMNQMVPMKDVVAGYTVNATSYAAGTYVIVVDFMNQHYDLKLIKL